MNPPRLDPPFQPLRNTVYSSLELLSGYDPQDPQSMVRTLDFKSYVYFVVNGRAAPSDPYAGMMQALHDNSVGRAMYAYLKEVARPPIAIMGGHREVRGSETYVDVATIAKRLTEEGFLMASGGGPGCMEATHLGALLAGRTQADLEDAVTTLSAQCELPPSHDIVAPDGTISEPIVALIHQWARPAVEVLEKYGKGGGESLAVPTWHYGHEPISPLATRVAKYFLNSIREDVLLALATNGIIFSEGRAGTLQEVFQDAAQNYYASDPDTFAPMVFWNENFWTNEMPIRPVLEALFIKFNKMKKEDYERKVLFTSDLDQAVNFLKVQQPSQKAVEMRMQSLGFGPMMATVE